MKLTPLDIHHKEFSRSIRGYNEVEVDAFLDEVADELERLFKENIDLAERIEAAEEKVRSYQEMERTLHNTLVAAQRSAEEIIEKAKHEAEVVLKEAEVKAKEIIHAALQEKQRTQADLLRIKQAEEEFRARFKALLEEHLRAVQEIPLPADVAVMTAQAGGEVVGEVTVAREEPASAAPAPKAARSYAEAVASRLTPAPTGGEPSGIAEASSASTEPMEPPASGFVQGLQLGEIAPPELPDEEASFEIPEFTLDLRGAEREDDLDIEEID